MIACMNEHPIIGELTTHNQTKFEACESLIFCLSGRRFVVVRKDGPSSLLPMDGNPVDGDPVDGDLVNGDLTDGDRIVAEPVDRVPINRYWPKIGRLRAGDKVVYKGEKATIRAVDRYR